MPRPAGRGQRDRLEDRRSIGEVAVAEHRAERGHEVAACPRCHCQGRAQQHDAEVGVLAHGLPRRHHGTENALAEPGPVAGQCRCRRCRAAAKIAGPHAVAGGEIMHVAGFWRRQLFLAGGDEAPYLISTGCS